MKDNLVMRINTSKEYEVHIGKGLLNSVGRIAANVVKPCKAVVVTDSNVEKLYADVAENSLKSAGFEVVRYTFIAGETSKNTSNLVDILEFFAHEHLTRTDIAVALGGGVVGDITGFAAAVYLRGIDFIQLPTTLLAAVDSSVGGKTAVDLAAGKNLAGAFHQPILVVCDTDTFATLPARETACGFAEIIKYAVVFDEAFFVKLEQGSAGISEIVGECVGMKRDVVVKDELDNGERKLLNFGHTAAHGIEKDSGYALTHGEAVAVGMVIASKIAQSIGMCNADTVDRIVDILNKYKLPISYEIDAHNLYLAALSDKKREGKDITLVLPEKIGKSVLKNVKVSELEALLEKGLQ